MVGRERRRGDQCGGSEGRRLLCVDEWRGSGRLWEMTGGVGEGRKRRAEVAGLGEKGQRPASVGWSR